MNFVFTNDKMCIKNEKLRIKNEEFCIQNDGFRRIGSLGGFEAFVLGAAARCLAEVLIYPYTRAKMVIVGRSKDVTKAKAAGDAATPGAIRKTLLLPISVIREIFRAEGFLSLYQGIGPQIARGILSSAIMLVRRHAGLQFYAGFVQNLCCFTLFYAVLGVQGETVRKLLLLSLLFVYTCRRLKDLSLPLIAGTQA